MAATTPARVVTRVEHSTTSRVFHCDGTGSTSEVTTRISLGVYFVGEAAPPVPTVVVWEK